jgi:hypothetical protein
VSRLLFWGKNELCLFVLPLMCGSIAESRGGILDIYTLFLDI